MDLWGVPLSAVLDRSGWAAVALIVLAVVAGRLVPRSVHEDRVRDKTDQIAYLQETLRVRDEQVRVRDEQVQRLLTQSDLTVALLQALAREAHRGDVAS